MAQAETAATRMPMITWVHLAFRSAEKRSAHGDAMSHRPSTKLIHSSHSANADSVASVTTASATPTIQAFQLGGISATYPMIQGEMNRQTARTRLTQSWAVLPSVNETGM